MLLLFFWVAAGGAPQEGITLSRLEVDLWPNYDRPGVLVIYRATLVTDSVLPVQLSFRIPASAGRPNAVAAVQGDGQLTTLEYERRVEGDDAVLTFLSSGPRIQIEYYDARIERQGARRSFTFRWRADYAVETLTLSAQQPDLARNLTTEPTGRSEAGLDGLTYHTYELQNVPAGESVTLAVAYDKVTDGLSVETMTPPEPTGAVAASADEEVPLDRWAALFALAVFLVVAAAVVRARLRGRVTESSPTSAAGAAFCTQCGGALVAGARFCGRCGAPGSGR